MALEILYEDDEIIAINKAPGILVHRSKVSSRTEPALLQIVRDHLGQRVHAVHRLDRATSGVLLFAKTSESASFLGQQFQSQAVEKIYQAVVRGWPLDQRIESPLQRLDNGKFQDAETEVKVLGRLSLDIPCDRYPQSRYAWLRLEPKTGRRHQLRRHLKHIHHPIIGDTVYGHGVHNRLYREELACHRLLLHNSELRFERIDGTALTIKAPHEEAFQRIIQLFDAHTIAAL